MTKLRTLVGLIFVGILIYSGLWHTSGFKAEKETAALFASWRDRGLRVEHGKIKLSGFPYRMVITVDGLQVRTRGPGLDFGAESLTFISHLWTPGHWMANATNIRVKAADDALILQDGSMRGSYRLHDNGKTMIVVDSAATDDFVLEKAPGLADPRSFKGWQLFLRTDSEEPANGDGLYERRFLDFKVTLDTGDSQFETAGGIMGPAIKDWSTVELGAWRDAGGLLILDEFMLTTPGGRIKGNASLTLDEAFRPLGSAGIIVGGANAAAAQVRDLGLSPLADEIKKSKTQSLSLMLQMGGLSLNGTVLVPLRPVIGD